MTTAKSRSASLFIELHRDAAHNRAVLMQYLEMSADEFENISGAELESNGLEPSKLRELHDLRSRLESGDLQGSDLIGDGADTQTSAYSDLWARSNAKLPQSQWGGTNGKL